MRRDALTGLVVTATSLFLFWLTLGLERNPLVPIGPAFYPRIVLAITALLAGALLISGLMEKPERPSGEKANYVAVAVQFVVFGLYVGALPLVGFRLATFAYVTAACALLEPPRRASQWLRAPVLGAATAAATWLAFERYLLVLLPRGSWTDF